MDHNDLPWWAFYGDHIGPERVLEDFPSMRPEPLPFPTWYDELDLRDNHDRAHIGLDDWQADFAADELCPECGQPKIRTQAVQLHGHIEGICEKCVVNRLSAL